MAEQNEAGLLADNASIITGQTAPDSITPATLGGLLADIIESMYNRVDGIDVSGMTIPPCFTGQINNGDLLPDILTTLMAAVCNIDPDSNIDMSAFRATKTVQQPLPNVTGNYVIYFEDDGTAPNYDNGNRFYTNQYLANGSIVKDFIVEQVKVTVPSLTTQSVRIRILKNGTEIATTTAVSSPATIDAYGVNITNGFTFPTLIAEDVTLAAGDIVTAEVSVNGNAADPTIEIGGIFSNS